MKKILFSLAAIAAFGIGQAQEETTASGFSKGDVFVSGSLGYSSQKTGEAKATRFGVVPRVGYFVSEKIAIGAQLGYSSVAEDYFNGLDWSESKTSSFIAGAFARYYCTPGKTFSFFGQLHANYVTSKTEPSSGEEYKRNGFEAGLAPGISYFVSDHFALETTFGLLGYGTSKPDADGAESTDTFNLNLDLTAVTFGIIYKF
ncbi:outer membrane beta-barrel protein [uncultured Flavobacterium sp.]|uniref:outer membrane beta-barrel protein n=1 Tax=uncultured Flavobacterium sp. TaxID=165435 RepID=UPI0025F9035B|nr:outer membrane beta-barrel protein [uncultured Flavobacterium sp.]